MLCLDFDSGHSLNQLYKMYACFLNSIEGVHIYAAQLLAA